MAVIVRMACVKHRWEYQGWLEDAPAGCPHCPPPSKAVYQRPHTPDLVAGVGNPEARQLSVVELETIREHDPVAFARLERPLLEAE